MNSNTLLGMIFENIKKDKPDHNCQCTNCVLERYVKSKKETTLADQYEEMVSLASLGVQALEAAQCSADSARRTNTEEMNKLVKLLRDANLNAEADVIENIGKEVQAAIRLDDACELAYQKRIEVWEKTKPESAKN